MRRAMEIARRTAGAFKDMGSQAAKEGAKRALTATR